MNLAAVAISAQPDKNAEILRRIRQAFAEKGFDGASMQDLARTAGMSVGNFYRYFPSKDAIVEAMVSHDLAEMERDFAAILGASNPLAAFQAKVAERLLEECDDTSELWAEITAASHRKPEIARICERMEASVASNLLAVFARISGLSLDECQTRFHAHARFMILLFKATASERAFHTDQDLQAMVLRNIANTLAEVSAPAKKD